jgi:hypothetical protein
MARNQKIESILAAWYHREKCPIKERAKAEFTLNRLLDEIRKDTRYSREDIKEHLYDHYLEHKRTRAGNKKLEDRHASE